MVAEDQTKYDLLTKISPYLDKHLLFPLLEHAQTQQIYKEADILRAQVDLLSKTKLLDSTMEKYKLLHKTEDVPAAMMDQRKVVVAKIKEIKADVKPLLTLLEDPALAKGDKRDKQFKDSLVLMAEKGGITQEIVEALFKYAKILFEVGNYGQVEAGAPMGAAEFLAIYRMLAKDPECDNALSAQWGQLAAEILLEKWGDAFDTFKKLRESIDNRQFANPLLQLEQRTWLIHWALFVYLKPEVSAFPTARNEMIELFFSERYMQAIQTNCPHVLRYLTVAIITAQQQRRGVLKEMVKVIQQEHNTYSDPITGFIECLIVDFDFDSAQEKLKQCTALLKGDYFLSGMANAFADDGKKYLFDTYCRLHQCIDIKMLAGKLDMTEDATEVHLVNLVKQGRLDAKMDSGKHQVIIGNHKQSVYQQVITKTKNLAFRSYVMADKFKDLKTKYDPSAEPAADGAM